MKTMIPELVTLTNEINKPRDERKIAHIVFCLNQYLTAREKLERERAMKKTLRYRVGAWFRRGFTAQ